ncbi:MAG TPA: hypothetical protein DCQ30_03235 [Acidimicrobiaceae bacterium]|nr:hypothetical protein [Acidimicrobiaceae bacterium]
MRPPAPAVDNDTYEVIDDAISALAGRRGLWMGDDVVIVHLVASLIAQAERFLPEAVVHVRAEGASWDEVARLVGTNPDEARLRFDPASPICDGRWPFDAD